MLGVVMKCAQCPGRASAVWRHPALPCHVAAGTLRHVTRDSVTAHT